MFRDLTFLLALFFVGNFVQAQVRVGNVKTRTTGGRLVDTTQFSNGRKNVLLSGTTKYTDYKIFSFKNDTTFVDTTLTIQKEYQFNFLRKDLFELLPFHNIGQTFNRLAYDYTEANPYPDIGFTGKQFFYQRAQDIKYYEVPTPTSEIMFKTTLEQGQFLNSLFTLNFSRRLNASIAYTGLRSLGKYRRSLVSQGFFRTTLRYQSKSGNYRLRTHIATQDLLNEENGGLTTTALDAFLSDDPNFTDRARLDVNLSGTENFFKGKRLYVEQDYRLLRTQDSTKTTDFSNLRIGHIFQTESKLYEFKQDALDTNFFGTSSFSGSINTGTSYNFVKNQFFVDFNSKYILGQFRVHSSMLNYEYGYSGIINQNSNLSTRKLKGDAIEIGAAWNARIKNFSLRAAGNLIPGNGRLGGNFIKGEALYKKDSVFTLKGEVLLNSRAPNFNFQLHQSVYDDYNWQNNFDNVQTRTIGGALSSQWLNASVAISNISNFTYFGEDNKPYQSSEAVNYLKLKVAREFRYKTFALDNTIMYQNVSSGSSVFRVPELVTRNTLYYQDYWFKGKPMLVMIGATFKHFTSYNANAYNPMLADFTLQNTEQIGFSTVDVFFNAQIRRTRIYFKIDNALSEMGTRNYFAAPGYPYRDFVIRFGLVWNWFI